jgi:WD40 repeat protein
VSIVRDWRGKSPDGTPWRVFLSHTSELSTYPAERSFVAAAKAAVERARHAPVEMKDFGAHAVSADLYCIEQVRSCQVYVGLIGFRYGSPTQEWPDLSYTELEFETATAAGLPRLVFLLDPAAPVPIEKFSDARYADRQRRFRSRLQSEAGLVVATFRDHAELELLVYDALGKLRDRLTAPAAPVDPPPAPVSAGARELPGAAGRRPWMVPSPHDTVVPRPELIQAVLTRVLGYAEPPGNARGALVVTTPAPPPVRRLGPDPAGTGAFGPSSPPAPPFPAQRPRVVTLHGVGGFGKTTLAAEVCRQPAIAGAFPGGVLWVTLGQSVSGAHLADKINDLCEALSGTRPALVDPEQAGFRLGELLGATSRLLVVDDVWTRAQLTPFLQGGPGCVRLVTTRMRDLAAGARSAGAVEVAAMADAEAVGLLTQDLDRYVPQGQPDAVEPTLPGTPAGPPSVLPADQLRRLLDATGRWPVLLRLVNRALLRMVRDGVPPTRAAERVLLRLARRGPTGVDGNQAVRATLAASLGLLTGDQHERYLELAIFPEDVEIPRYVLEAYWGATGHLDPDEVDDLCQELADLSLVLGYRQQPAALLLQDVLRSYLRAEVGPDRRRELDGVLCDALRARLLGPAAEGTASRELADGPWAADGLDGRPGADLDDGPTVPTPAARPGRAPGLPDPAPGPRGPATWWELPQWAGYVWTNLLGHLAGAARADEALALLRDLRWTAAKLAQPALGLVAVDADLALATELAPTDPVPRALRRVLRQAAHLFGPTDPPEALATVLVSRLDGIPALADARARLAGTVTGPRLVNRWPLPDQPHPGLVRVLPGQQYSINSCAIAPAGDWLASAADDGTIQLWDADGTTARVVLTGHRGAVHACAIFPDGRLLVSAGADGIVRIWDADGGPARFELAGHTGEVRGAAVAPSGRWFATCGDDGTVRCWYVHTGEPARALDVTPGTRVRAVAVGPDRLLAAACEDGVIRLYDMRRRGEPAGQLAGHRGPVRHLAASSGSAWLVSVGDDGTARRWDPAARTQVTRYELGAAGPARGCAVSADGSLVAATAGDGVVRLWETTTGARRQLVGPTRTAAVCAISPDGGWLVSAGRHGVLRIWDTRGTDPDVAAGGRDEGMRGCVASHDGRWIVSVSEDATAVRWDVATAEPGAALMGERPTSTRGGAVAPDDSWVALPGRDGGVRLWEPTADAVRAVIASPSEVRAFAAGPDGGWLVGACADGVVRKWDTQSGEWLESFRAWPPVPYQPGEASTDGGTTGGRAGRDPTDGDTIQGGGRQACVVAPDGAWMAAGGADGDLRVWDTASLEQLAVLSGHDNEVLGLAVAPDARFLVSTGADHTVRVWWTDGWRPGPVLSGHTHTVRAAAVSPDGAFVASAGGDGSARVWETSSWRCVTLMRFDGAARDCAWLPDSRGFALAASGGLYLYDLVVG